MGFATEHFGKKRSTDARKKKEYNLIVWGLGLVNEKSYAIIMFWNNDTGAVPVLGVVIVVLWVTLWATL